ncbi:hypothetical protein Tco_0000664 [Tanacetum coccineum]
MVISSPCLTDIKNWLVQSKRLLLASPKQTALGKDFSNPLIVDSLLKTIWLSMHHVVTMKHWLFQSKRLLDMSYDHHSSVSSARRLNVSGDMRLIPSFSIKKLNLSLGKGLVKMSSSCNKLFPACHVKSVGSTTPLEKCCEIRKLDSMSYHARGACLRP